MKSSKIAVLTFAAALAATPLSVAAAPHHTTTQSDLQKEAKIPMSKARSIALGRVRNGHIRSAELERERGHLIYSFDISEAKRSGVTEVNVDATNGKIIAVQHENAAKEAAEAKQEAKEKSSKH